MEESISAARKELEKINSGDPKDKEALKKADTCLDEGIKALEKRQKHIKVAIDRISAGPLCNIMITIHSDDEKRLEKAERRLNKHPLSASEEVALVVKEGGIGVTQLDPALKGEPPQHQHPCHPCS